MPRKIDPAKIKVGHGLATSDSVEVNAMIPSGAGSAPVGLTTHVQDEHNAHPAHSISIDDVPETYDSDHVEGVLDELSALVPPRPPTIGNKFEYLDLITLPDWGILKVDDASIAQRHPSLGLDWEGSPQQMGWEVYPYYWRAPKVVSGDTPDTHYREFYSTGDGLVQTSTPGNDPADTVFNVWSPGYVGGGPGNAHIGAFTRLVDDGSGSFEPTFQSSASIIPSSGVSGGKKIVVSGIVYPADRGTVALIRCGPGGDLEEFCHDPDLLKRCLAAINLGQGILDKCDGDPGGIFTMGSPGGEDAPHSTDPYAFPGRATGQYNLEELHTGLHEFTGAPLPEPFDDFDDADGPGWNYGGQVRLGTDPNAGVALIPDGVPILGGSTSARAGGHDDNFLAYRVPYMDSYSDDSGLRYTPPLERHRFYTKPNVADNPSGPLDPAGNYPAFPKEYWTWQIARYRHQFKLTDEIIVAGEPRESGSYMLIHFKKEEYFEDLVRDGNWPSNEKVYSVNLLSADIESLENKQTQWPGAPLPLIPSDPYHVLRSLVYEDPDGATPVSRLGFLAKITAEQNRPMTISGVNYHCPQDWGSPTGGTNLLLEVLLKYHGSATAPAATAGFWEHSYRTQAWTEDVPHVTHIANEYPVFWAMGHFTSAENIEAAGMYSGPGQTMRERFEFSGRDLADHLADTPVHTDTATLDGKVYFTGDADKDLPKFSTDAVVRSFVRRPLGHLSNEFGAAPTTAEIEVGIYQRDRIEYVEDLGGFVPRQVLFHSARSVMGEARYGNLIQGGSLEPRLFSLIKDSQERFLDEAYRWHSGLLGSAGSVTTPNEEDQLRGPGLPHGPTPIKVPVRLVPGDLTALAGHTWEELSYVVGGWYRFHLTDPLVIEEAQVAGLPDRDPLVTEGVTSALPSNGILLFPQHDYTSASPSTAINPGYHPQPNYGAIPTSGDRSWVRCFSVAEGEGQPFVSIRLKGIELDDFKRAPGMVGSEKMAILVKIPGLTTWLDLGRKDGDGPSKQDVFADGAGCMVVGPGTHDHLADVADGIVGCEVRANLGPAANLFNGYFRTSGADPDSQEVPLLMKIVMKDHADALALNFEQGGPQGPCAALRGLIQVDVSKG
jgi:hypothetical protein